MAPPPPAGCLPRPQREESASHPMPDARNAQIILTPRDVTSLQLVRTAALLALAGNGVGSADRVRAAVEDVTRLISRVIHAKDSPA